MTLHPFERSRNIFLQNLLCGHQHSYVPYRGIFLSPLPDLNIFDESFHLTFTVVDCTNNYQICDSLF